MKKSKSYTEKQYREYSQLMEEIANTDDVVQCMMLCNNAEIWCEENGITEHMQTEMANRLELEDTGVIEKEECKVIPFRKREE